MKYRYDFSFNKLTRNLKTFSSETIEQQFIIVYFSKFTKKSLNFSHKLKGLNLKEEYETNHADFKKFNN